MALVGLVLVGSTGLSVYLSGPSTLVSLASNIVVFGLLFLNIILVLLLLFLVARNLVKLLFERKRNVFGAKLRTKFVVAFVGFSVVPAVVLFLVAISYIGKSTDLWLSYQIEQSLGMAREITELMRNQKTQETLGFARSAARLLAAKQDLLDDPVVLTKHLEEKRRDLQVDLLAVYLKGKDVVSAAIAKNLAGDPSVFSDRPKLRWGRLMKGEEYGGLRHCALGQMVEGVVPLYRGYDPKDIAGAVVAGVLIPRSLDEPMAMIAQTHEQYRELTKRKELIELNYYVILTVALLVVVFLSSWFGFFMAKQITVPLQALAEKTREVANGKLDFRIEDSTSDEVGILIASFNEMAERLRESYGALEASKRELKEAWEEAEKRRAYTETILEHIASGVMSLDSQGRIMMLNPAVKRLLELSSDGDPHGRLVDDVLPEETLGAIKSLLEELREGPSRTSELEVHISRGGYMVPFKIVATSLKGEGPGQMGAVVVFDDLTNTVKAQKIAAWKEVARRMAHEIKNPLTPIKLSAQRIRKRHPELLEVEGGVVDECTRIIIEQVDHLQEMVNEFQRFARMPEPHKVPQDLNQVVQDVLFLYREAHPDLCLVVDLSEDLPQVPIDVEQMKRVLINLLNNALAVIPEKGGRIEVRTAFNRALKVARMEVADNGPGIPPSHRPRLFEPYFSTKETGIGLGLTIVKSIVMDHGGYVRVLDNEPQGTRFVIELPL